MNNRERYTRGLITKEEYQANKKPKGKGMITIKDVFKDLDILETHLKNIRERLFWYQYKEAATVGQTVYQEAGHIAASLELLSNK